MGTFEDFMIDKAVEKDEEIFTLRKRVKELEAEIERLDVQRIEIAKQ